ncbi:alpha-amlyase [Alteromonas aestuariivivens]|uniref:Alpha-amlyase n=1 Tax=Alteromonas aestuariivivens TaxID=1938339 RepID=A0A3D8M4X3_9ALTE|nr:alpha-amylase family glycosyl hydrolase [Alteromonas aestuariivivens]RDV24658.1 alpha-amlyase [Alteromonas aestuariivivens]
MPFHRFPVQSPYRLTQPQWSANAVIYQVNTRQFSDSGTFSGVRCRLSEIRSLGVDIIWLMPIHPIGEKFRKGTLGSPYAVKDYYGVNEEFGSEEEFRDLITAIHAHGMRVILDWVPNHSAWDNALVDLHPEWYARDYKGDFRPSPWWDWDDIIEFDYAVPELREYMIDAMCYWVKEFDIDGFRCDVAGYVPNDFWHQARAALDAVKPVFMLAEWEDRDLHENAFNMTYAWSWNEVLHDIAHGRQPLDKLRKYYSWNERAWPRSAYRMTFVSNHDKNAWDGTQSEQFGPALEACIVLSVIGEGMPLIYNGQEAGETKRLAFFERDPIEWQPHPIGDLYRHLIKLKKSCSALWNGPFGATMIQVPNSRMSRVFSFVRGQDGDKVMVLINFSDQAVTFELEGNLSPGKYVDAIGNEPVEVKAGTLLSLPAWGYQLLFTRLSG